MDGYALQRIPGNGRSCYLHYKTTGNTETMPHIMPGSIDQVKRVASIIANGAEYLQATTSRSFMKMKDR
jgi:hypothetical protein